MKTKTCFKCGTEQPLDNFYKHKMMADGHLGKCKTCAKLDVSTNYNKNFKHYREYEAKRFKTRSRKKQVEESQKRMRVKHPDKYKARTAVHNAIRDGKLKRHPCEVCHNPKAQAHHHDYSKPLDVKWLCFVCHRLEHGQNNVTT